MTKRPGGDIALQFAQHPLPRTGRIEPEALQHIVGDSALHQPASAAFKHQLVGYRPDVVSHSGLFGDEVQHRIPNGVRIGRSFDDRSDGGQIQIARAILHVPQQRCDHLWRHRSHSRFGIPESVG